MHDSKFQHRLILWGFLAVVVIMLFVWQGAQLYVIESERELLEETPLSLPMKPNNHVTSMIDWGTPIDVQACVSGDSRVVYHGLGSNATIVRGRTARGCVIETTIEVEGGYTTRECTIIEKDFIKAEELIGFSGCTVVKEGNLLRERSTQ